MPRVARSVIRRGLCHDSGATARITALFVDPLFVRLGIGRRLTRDVEVRVRAAGFDALSVRATDNAVGFFLSLGFQIASQGVTARAADIVLPVTFMRKGEAGLDDASG